MLIRGVSFKEAEQLIQSREPKETALNHKKIMQTWSQDMRNRAFFSARCTSAAVLSQLKTLAEKVVSGAMTQKQAVRLAREMFATDSDALAAMGFAPKKDAHGLTELASIPRLNLIFYTQMKMAQEKGHFDQWQEVKDKYPYGIWRCGYAEEHRPEHLARNGKVYAFDHPIWRQSPPGGEFNCHCYRELITEAQLQQMGLTPEPMDGYFAPSSLGFDPSLPFDSFNGIQPGNNIPPEYIVSPRPFPNIAKHTTTQNITEEPTAPANTASVTEETKQQQKRAEGSITREQTALDALRFGYDLIEHFEPDNINNVHSDIVNRNINTKGWEYSHNCQRCVIAAEARLRGLNVEALPRLLINDALPNTFAEGGWPTVFENTTADDLIFCDGNAPEEVQKNIANKMLEFGEGARAIINVVFPKEPQANSYSAHVFGVVVLHGRVVFYDPQDSNYDVLINFRHCLKGQSGDSLILNPCILRTDTLMFTDKILQCCKKRG